MYLLKTKTLKISLHSTHKWKKGDLFIRHEFRRKRLGIEWVKYTSVGYGKNPFSFILVFNLIWFKFWLDISWKVMTFTMD